MQANMLLVKKTTTTFTAHVILRKSNYATGSGFAIQKMEVVGQKWARL